MNPQQEIEKQNVEIFEPILFTRISAQNLGKSAPSKTLFLLEIIAHQCQLNLTNPLHYVCAKIKLSECIINN